MKNIELFYFVVAKNGTLGRGENIKLLLEDAGLEHKYFRELNDNNWPVKKAQLSQEGYLCPTLPYMKVDGKIFGKTLPIMRYISSKLDNKYHGANAEENYHLDYISDIISDWFEHFKNAFFGSDEQKLQHKNVTTPKYLELFEKFYATNQEGPYLIGEKITYPDFLVYHMIDDESAWNSLAGYSNLAKFIEAFKQRPNINAYLTTLSTPSN